MSLFLNSFPRSVWNNYELPLTYLFGESIFNDDSDKLKSIISEIYVSSSRSEKIIKDCRSLIDESVQHINLLEQDIRGLRLILHALEKRSKINELVADMG